MISKEDFKNGWFATGDIGRWIDGRLYIVDRKKNLVKLSSGEYIAYALARSLSSVALPDGHAHRGSLPNNRLEKLETLYKESSLVENVMIHADTEENVLVAVVQPSKKAGDDEEAFKKEFEAIRGELKDKSNCLITKDELNRLTRQMNSLITTLNNHKVSLTACCVSYACVRFLAGSLTEPYGALQSNQDIERGEPHIQAESERKKKRRKRLLIGGAILLGLLLLVVVIICIVVPVAVLAGGSSSSTTGNGNANGNKNGSGNGAARSLRAYSDQGGTGWSEVVAQHDRGERGGGIGATAASAGSTRLPAAPTAASERRSKEPAVRCTAGG